MTNKLEIQLPFSGFYETMHSYYIDSLVEQYSDIDDEVDTIETQQEKLEQFSDTVNYKETFINYAKKYTKELSDYIDVELEFVELDSPKEYNFTTDRIFASIDSDLMDKIQTVVLTCYKQDLINYIKDRFTSHDGFVSSYPNKLANFLTVKDDYNTRGVFLDIFITNHLNVDDDTLKDLLNDCLDYEDIKFNDKA